MIHQYKLNGYNFVLDVYSGGVHLVDEVAYDVIALFECLAEEALIAEVLKKHGDKPDVNEEEIRACLADVAQLKAEGKLFAPDAYAGHCGACTTGEKKTEPPVIKALCLHVAHSCNLNCSYCFASQGNYHGERALMSLEVGRRALDFLIEHSGSHVNLEVDFFGGEPLMNWKVVKELVAYAREQEKIHHKNFRFTLTTNGVLLDEEVMDFAQREMHNVVLSLDGRPEVHDRFRKNFAGEGSYDLVMPKFQELVKKRGGKDYYVRGTFTRHNLDFTQDLYHMAELGFRELSMEPVVCPPTDPCALREEDLPQILEQYEALAKEMLRRKKAGDGFTFYHYMLDLAHGPCLHKRMAGCGSGTEYLAVTPWGELFPCHQFVNEPDYSMGNVWDGVKNTALREVFGKSNVEENEDCQACWAKLYCAGGCAANAYHATGSVHGTYAYGCTLFKKRMECAIMLQVAEQLEGEETTK